MDPHRYKRTLSEAEGYMELGLISDAMETLRGLDDWERRQLPAQLLMLHLLIKNESWPEAVVFGQKLLGRHPDAKEAYLHTAYCLHASGRTGEARDTLLAAPRSIRADALFHYNLACYEAVLGRADQAIHHLEKSIAMNPAFRDQARHDPDLDSLRERIR